MEHSQFDVPGIEDRAELQMACVRRRVSMGELPEFYDSAYPAIFDALDAAGVTASAAPLGIVYGAAEGVLDLAVAVPVAAEFAGNGQVSGASLPAARTAVLTVHGDYEQLADAHEYLQAWVRSRGERPLGWAWEQYLTQPQPGGDPSANITQIGVGLRD